MIDLSFLEKIEKNYKKFLKLSFWYEKTKEAYQKFGKKFVGGIIFFLLFFVSLVSFYFLKTKVVPAYGGEITEGIITQPRFINPLYADNDTDRDLVELIFSGLLKYDQKGNLVNDLIDDYQIKEEGKVYEFKLKDNIFWHDGKKITADDVIFTIQIIKNPTYRTPLIISWFDVEIQKLSEDSFLFRLKQPYNSFLENCTIKILPKHIWEKVLAENLPLTLSEFPKELLIGSGPFKIKEIKFKEGQNTKIESIVLERNQNYHLGGPYLSKITFKFFDNYKDIIKAFNKKEIGSFALLAPVEMKSLHSKYYYSYLKIPRYFALFFNLKKAIFSEKEVRKAISFAINKKEIVEKIFHNQAEIAKGPLLDNYFEIAPPTLNYEYDSNKAKEVLEKAGFFLNDQQKREKLIREEKSFEFKKEIKPGQRGKEVKQLQECLSLLPFEIFSEKEISGFYGNPTKKAVAEFQKIFEIKPVDGIVGKKTLEVLNQTCKFPKETLVLKFSISTLDDPLLEKVAQMIKEDLGNLGIDVDIVKYPLAELIKKMQDRDFDTLLFGQAMNLLADPFSFWASSQKENPGLNITSLENEKIDEILEKIRTTQDFQTKKESLENFQNLLLEEIPAVFLYTPNYYYFYLKEIKGIEKEIKISIPAGRFWGVKDWYIKTKRIFK